ncbi:hypothetical protein D3C83_199450 [compost metagenome]
MSRMRRQRKSRIAKVIRGIDFGPFIKQYFSKGNVAFHGGEHEQSPREAIG